MTDVASGPATEAPAEAAVQASEVEAQTAVDAGKAAEAAVGTAGGTPADTAAQAPADTAAQAPADTAAVSADRDRAGAEQVRGQVVGAVERAASAAVEHLRNESEMVVERGATHIDDEVVEKIAGKAVRGVPGVYDIGGDVARFFAELKERAHLGDADEDTDRGMRARLEGNTAKINVTLVIEYGHVVSEVTEKVRAEVIKEVESLLGLEVTEVNIIVDGVHVPDDISTSPDDASPSAK